MFSGQHNARDDDDDSLGVIHYFGLSQDECLCGYCKSNRNPESTYGLWAHYLPPRVYKGLIDRNWRRCGKYVYKPINNALCCPMYTIRCDATDFKLTKSQKKTIKKFNNYIGNDIKPTNGKSKNLIEPMGLESERLDSIDTQISTKKDINMKCIGKNDNDDERDEKAMIKTEEVNTTEGSSDVKEKKSIDFNKGKSEIKVTKKKYIRRQKLIEKIRKRENCSEERAKQLLWEKSCQKQKTKTLEDYLSEIENFATPKHTFKTRIIRVKSKTDENDRTDYEVFKKYQMKIHKEKENKISYRSYARFLIDSPLDYILIKRNFANDHDLPRFYGAYHQHYYIDDKLVAVGVIDILPGCISSVYLYYDPEYSFLNLGVYSALNEIAMVRKFSKILPDLKYYYMGYYIHQCPKMRYKAKYLPSDLLCSETYRWFSIESCLKKLEQNKYARFCDDPTVQDDDCSSIDDCDIKVFFKNMVLNYRDYKRLTKNNDHEQKEKINEYIRLVGHKCSLSLLYFIGSD